MKVSPLDQVSISKLKATCLECVRHHLSLYTFVAHGMDIFAFGV